MSPGGGILGIANSCCFMRYYRGAQGIILCRLVQIIGKFFWIEEGSPRWDKEYLAMVQIDWHWNWGCCLVENLKTCCLSWFCRSWPSMFDLLICYICLCQQFGIVSVCCLWSVVPTRVANKSRNLPDTSRYWWIPNVTCSSKRCVMSTSWPSSMFFLHSLVGGEFHWISLHNFQMTTLKSFCILFVTGYDCTQRSTFEHVKYWQDEVRRHVSMETVMLDGCVGRPTAFLGGIFYIVLRSVLPLFGGQILSCA